MGFLPLLPSYGKSGKRMNYGIFATFAIIWQKWQKIINRIFATFAIIWQKWQKIINRIFATFAIIRQKWQKDELMDFCHICHHMAKVAKDN